MNGSSSSSSSYADINSLHDVILNYVETSGYASTARILARSPPRHTSLSNGKPFAPASLGDEGGMEIDEDDIKVEDGEDSGVGSSSHKKGKGVMKDGLRFTEDDLEQIENRRNILNHILNGSITKAVDLLRTHFPSVLDESLGPGPDQPVTNGSSSHYIYPKYPSNHSVPVLIKSTNPSHVKLNLQIQQFIESLRQLNPSSSNGTGSMPSSPSSSIGSLGNSGSLSSSSMGLTHTLSAAQGLHSEAKKLPPDIRAIYLQEIQEVGALLAYADPENGPLKGFLSQDRRIKLSEMVNAAILRSQGIHPESALGAYARRTTVLYRLMAEYGLDPKTNWGTSVSSDGVDGRNQEHLAEYWKQANGKPFSLHNFVHSTW
ncbi:uncharacterized protein I303_104615 [Kwoniella dejecticola CBS 10117]|uniref:CTLH domain-containing protein n=1 Tax=Kwoniella dejecticola CBS 10117 TaxID=1296121 RepID=A0A1A6A4T9_9TREE|nr:uncharacterized protein I303_04407 [Kwoniella dejecticola CBS 10117]OBR85076.1 hypothetical protein I303_04407 [Kwoniella dejecticola CBS 10117]